jgi:hypothetical protein
MRASSGLTVPAPSPSSTRGQRQPDHRSSASCCSRTGCLHPVMFTDAARYTSACVMAALLPPESLLVLLGTEVSPASATRTRGAHRTSLCLANTSTIRRHDCASATSQEPGNTASSLLSGSGLRTPRHPGSDFDVGSRNSGQRPTRPARWQWCSGTTAPLSSTSRLPPVSGSRPSHTP